MFSNIKDDEKRRRESRDEQSKRYIITQTPEYLALEKKKAEILEVLKPLEREHHIYDHEAQLVARTGNLSGALGPGYVSHYAGRPIEQLRREILAARKDLEEVVQKMDKMKASIKKPVKATVPQEKVDLCKVFKNVVKHCPQGHDVYIEDPRCRICGFVFDQEAVDKLPTDAGAVRKPKSDYTKIHKDVGHGFSKPEKQS